MDSWFYALLAVRKKLETGVVDDDVPEWLTEPAVVRSLMMFTELSRDPRVSGRFAQLHSHVDRVAELTDVLVRGVEPESPNYWFLLGYNIAVKSVGCVADELRKRG